MPTLKELTNALNELEADLGRYTIPSAALVYLKEENDADELRRVYRAVSGLGFKIPVVKNSFDHFRLEGTQYSVINNRFTGRVVIQTLVGKLVLPEGSKIRLVGTF